MALRSRPALRRIVSTNAPNMPIATVLAGIIPPETATSTAAKWLIVAITHRTFNLLKSFDGQALMQAANRL